MIAFDGQFYQLLSDGSAHVVNPDWKTPFATVSFFKAQFVFDIPRTSDRNSLENLIEQKMKTAYLFYAIPIDGFFRTVRTRTVSRQNRPFPGLEEAAAHQQEFDFENVAGTVVGFRSPNYAQGLTVPGYHFHFLRADKQGGGHVHDFEIEKGRIMLDSFSSLYVAFPDTLDFYTAKARGGRRGNPESREMSSTCFHSNFIER